MTYYDATQKAFDELMGRLDDWERTELFNNVKGGSYNRESPNYYTFTGEIEDVLAEAIALGYFDYDPDLDDLEGEEE